MKNNIYSTKQASEIKDLNSEKREVAVYLSIFDNLDSDNDVITKGAFTKSILERGPDSITNRKIAFLRHHDWQQPIGKFLKLEEDVKGLFAVAQLGRSTMGEDAFKDYEDGIIREHSIGFQYLKDKVNFIEDKNLEGGGYHQINEVKLFEGSAVTFGSNEETNVIDVIKSQNKTAYIDKITNELNVQVKALSNGKGSDERLYEIEMKIKYLNSQLVLLALSEPMVKNYSVISEPMKKDVNLFDWNKVVNNINFKNLKK